MYVGEVPLSNLQPGYYNIDIKSGENTIVSRGFQVLTYTKPAYKIDITPSSRAVFGGEIVTFAGQTDFFEGTPVPKVGLSYSGSISGQTTSDNYGEFEIVYPTEYAERDEYGSLIHYPRAQTVNVNPSLAEEGEIIGGARLAVFGSDAALRASTEIVESKGTVRVEVNRIVLDRLNDGGAEDDDYLGEPLADQPVSGALYENRWEKEEVGEYYDFINKVVRKKYRYHSVRDFLGEISLVADRRGQAVYEFTLDLDKYYIVELETVGSRGRTAYETVYLYGTRYNYFGRESNYYHIDSGDPTVGYSVGDQVSLTFKNGSEVLPSGGENRYLFNVAQRGIRDFQPQNSPTFEFEFEDAYVPNVSVSGIYFNGRTFFDGGTSLVRFDTQDKKLNITVSPDKSSYRPGEQVNLDVAVVDGEGRGQRAEVNISLVDEALFKLQDQSVDTLGSLYRSVGSGILQTYVSHQYPLDLAGAEGGGCFLAGTKIRMSDGPDKDIEDIEVGDLILTRDEARSSRLVAAKVTETFEHIVSEYLLINDFLEVTPEHNLFVNGRWTVAEDVRPGDYLLNDRDEWFEVASIESLRGRFEVYNLEVEKQRTFFAGGVFVHNQKGRNFFADQAFFGVVQTDGGGHGRVGFKLPDNLTSWRITYQGISESLGAGYGARLLPVKLPLFVDVVLNEEYLVADKPIIKLRAFGEGLNSGQEVVFELEAPTLGLEKGLKISGRAFEAAPFELPNLSEGEHQISITARSGGLEDTLTRKIRVYRSRLTKSEVNYYQLAEDTQVVGGEQYPTTLIFSDQNRGRYYSILTQLAYAFGDRIDQKLARIRARQLLNEYFEENAPPEALDSSNYQTPSGGLSLFPYSDADLTLSAKIAVISGDEFDQAALQQYFLGILNDPDEGRERAVVSLYGLAALGEPV
ncbi:hypothetical protein L6258_01060, partial [Candidatus Parcubacteria bacterium]|nr:hypothetical protein [Candidatus Parcubacteria bacterium]